MSKIDIFKGLLWYSYVKDGMNWHQLSVEKANEIIALNNKGKKVASLEEIIEDTPVSKKKELFSNVVGQDSLTRFDQPKQKRKKRRKKSRNRNKNRNRNSKKNA